MYITYRVILLELAETTWNTIMILSNEKLRQDKTSIYVSGHYKVCIRMY